MMSTVCAVLSSQLCLLAQQNKTEEKIRVAASETEDVIEMKISQIIKGVSWTLRILQHEDLLPIAEKMDTTKKQVMEILSHNADQILQLSEDSLLDTSSTSYPILSDQLEDDVMHGLDDDFEIIVNRLIGRPRDLEQQQQQQQTQCIPT
ncbi:putative serine/threonine-protein phosphatase 2A 65 kDa regulatory subunit A beta isoform-like [Capsicum annuum]|nr:putative serine/threonine-protein phosphatase 2A 65 kDa regulatory subunit A beta isoform-like [Capsicum annuum]